MISEFLIIIGSLLIGYTLGNIVATKEHIADTHDLIKKTLDRSPVGAIKRPNAERLDRIRDPKKYEEELAMIELLKQQPELNNDH